MSRIALHPSRAIADLLRTRREELSLTLRDVEKKSAEGGGCPIPFTTLAKVEKAKVDPGLKRLYRLLNLYHLPLQMVGDLLDLEELADILPADRNPETLYKEGVKEWKGGDIRKGLAHLFTLRHLVQGKPDSRIVRQKSLLSFAVAAGSLGKFQLSRQIVDDILLEPPDPTLLVPVLIQAAHCWHWLGSGEAALAFLSRAEARLKPGEDQHRAWIFHEKASVLVDLADFKHAESVLALALDSYEKAGDLYGVNRAMAVRTRLRFEQEDAAGALQAAQAARDHAARNGFDRLERLWRIEEGRAYLLLNDASSSLSSLSAALAESLLADDRIGQFYAHYYLWKARETIDDPGGAEVELKSALYFERFVDEVTKETLDIRALRTRKESK